MIALVPAVGGALIVGGAIAALRGAQRRPEDELSKDSTPSRPRTRLGNLSHRSRILLAAGLCIGVIGWLVTGWFLLLILGPVAAMGVPMLIWAPPSVMRLARLNAMEEWTRSLASVLTVGIGLEQALVATLRSTPAPINDEVRRLVARLRARWDTETALHAFADELDDATGDLIAATLILGARRRGAGLASVLEGLAESVADDVRARRQVEADRAKPRATARWVTIISISVLGVLALSGSYVAPYGTPIGQLLLAVFLTAYVATLVWMRRMAAGRPLPRILKDSDQFAQTVGNFDRNRGVGSR